MIRALSACALLSAAALVALATPPLPRVPRGFDEGRTAIVQEAEEGLIDANLLVERLFEYSDLHDVAAFLANHLETQELQDLDAALELDGALTRSRDADAVQNALATAGITPARAAAALGRLLDKRQLSLSEVVNWLYARGFNFRVLQRAMNGERMDAFNLRRRLRALPDRSAAKLISPGLWEFNLLDAREEKGGHYSGVQLVEAMLALGFGADDFDAVLKSDNPALTRKLTAQQRKLIAWGDPELIWPFMESGLPESTLIRRITARYADHDDPRVLQVALLRTETTLRWFRTGGPGVTAVYRGPWPDNQGNPKPPKQALEALADADVARAFPSDEISGHFDSAGDTLTLVLYSDGSARGILHRPSRQPSNFGAASPMGNRATRNQMYEGRVSVAGRNGLLYLVYGGGLKVAPVEFEFASVTQVADGALLRADMDDGVNYVPVLLRRVNRLIEIKD